VKTQQKGMQIKNKHSSSGRLKTFTPNKYLELKPQKPFSVNQTSQKINKGIISRSPINKEEKNL
tara:strand:+ start:237 stop:428 length:192 start_codon:yes stop_codon:yes gene_type:complete